MESIRMTTKDLKKVEVLALISKGEMKMAEGAQKLRITKRHLRRIRRTYEKEGGKGVAHKSRGRRSRNAFPEKLEEEIAKLLHQRYSDFGPTFAAEKISEDLGRSISKEKVRQLQMKEGLWKAKRKKEQRYHPRRARRSRRGELVQIDGSDHDWLEGRGERMSLILFIDDATSETPLGKFVKAETTRDYMRVTKEYIEEKGAPVAFYSDKHSIFRQNQKEGHLKGDLTQYGTALKELGIELICAHSPQAKGRVERSFGTHQDRLVKEMRLAGIESLEEANLFLKEYLKKHNKRFSVEPALKENAHKKIEMDLDKTFTIREKRVLSKGLSFQYKNILYQLKNPKKRNRLQNQKIQISEKLNGELLVETVKGESLQIIPYSEYTGEVQRTLDVKEIGAIWATKRITKPKRKHPWR